MINISFVKMIGIYLVTIVFGVETFSTIQKISTHPQQRDHQGKSNDHSNQDYFCGVNGLYILLHLLDREVSYETVLQVIPPNRQGHSFLQLRDAAVKLDLECEIYKSTLARLSEVKTPVIILLKPRSQEKLNIGHFIVVTHYADERYHTIDPTTSLSYAYRADQLERRWTGYVLMPTVSYGNLSNLFYIFPLLILCLVRFSPLRHLICIR